MPEKKPSPDTVPDPAPARPHLSIPPGLYESGGPRPRSTRAARLFGVVVALLVVVAGIAGWRAWTTYGLGSSPTGWHSSYASGMKAAGESRKPALILFTANWSVPCRQLRRTVLSDEDVIAALSQRYVLIRVSLNDRSGPNGRVARQHGVDNVPTVVVLGPNGREIHRTSGQAPIKRWIDRTIR